MRTVLHLTLLSFFCLLESSCQKEEDPIDPTGSPSTIESYVGIATGNDCIDKITFVNHTTRTFAPFSLLVEFPAGQVWDAMSSYPLKISEREYYSSTITPLCHMNGEYRYANLHFTLDPDSVWMNFKFWELGGESGVFVDSVDVVLRRKK